jgi:hypothetical protein
MNLHEQVIEWENLWLAYQKASRGKRGLAPAAEFEFDLADNLLEAGSLTFGFRELCATKWYALAFFRVDL